MSPDKGRPPLLATATGAGLIDYKTYAFQEQLNRESKGGLLTPATCDHDLWKIVAKGARWRKCPTHGKVKVPDLIERVFRSGRSSHIKATCPDCGRFLGHLPQAKRKVDHPRFIPVQEPLWAKADPTATWKPCPEHGVVAKPVLWEQVSQAARQHLRAYCPSCWLSLGFVKRKKAFVYDTPEDMRRVYRRFLAEAAASGYKKGQAYFRFKSRYGCDPDPAWAN